jgi:hypothetical protein
MENQSQLQQKEARRAALLEEAERLVRAVEAQSRTLTSEEDSVVLHLMTRVRELEEEIARLKRHEDRP